MLGCPDPSRLITGAFAAGTVCKPADVLCGAEGLVWAASCGLYLLSGASVSSRVTRGLRDGV